MKNRMTMQAWAIGIIIVAVIAIIDTGLTSHSQQLAAQFTQHYSHVQEQAKVVQVAVERWASTNSDKHYPSGLDELNGAGQTVVDLLPNGQRLLNSYDDHLSDGHYTSCYSEPRNWGIRQAESDLVLAVPKGAIYYCPKPDGKGYFIRAYVEGPYPTILTNRR